LSIPKKLHAVWVGDESKCPHQWLQTWRDKHPAWEFKLWGNAEYDSVPWRSKRQMDIFRACGEWNAVADLMRYEILCEHGGVYVDADSMSVRAFDDWLLARIMQRFDGYGALGAPLV
jgi:mannosyltransferase OCH1-like enzyme